ncbi:gustatory receptor for sugar taste 64e-like [Danaus plexippus]|uniref:gustatory receptor for sugar taste 64e-like n=1 Tax=Danaus plexippus TaxID=13037 RepID=UPI002AAFD86F|nr:gustatory receptor for sugar taste 64e-like [Danaus plexippus]
MKVNVYCEMHVCLRVLMRLCRWAGFFPVEGLDKLNMCEIRYNIRSFYAFYYIITLLSQTYFAGYTIYWSFTSNLGLETMTNLLFHATGVLSNILLLNLARKWFKILRRAADIEKRAFMICPKTINVVVLQTTFLWNFTDVMTICLSTYLTGYFQNFNNIIEENQKERTVKWGDIRMLHTHLVALVMLVDKNMCYLILLSFFTNLFFICAQFFYLMSIEDFVYYFYSFSFLLTRSCVTSFLAANIHTVSKRPLMIIQHLPSAEYDIEIQRLIRQIRYTTTALSGVFFHITRGMILQMVGTIVTYELVLLQFT